MFPSGDIQNQLHQNFLKSHQKTWVWEVPVKKSIYSIDISMDMQMMHMHKLKCQVSQKLYLSDLYAWRLLFFD